MALPRSAHVTIHRAALEAIFDECDRYDHDETGGRLLGTFKLGHFQRLSITVSAIIEPGPKASRTPTSFFQDGEYQEQVFRALERQHPEIEHLGNWHTHHVNGYPTLSGGDRETYHRIVDHPKHNTDFFYALLVTARNPKGAKGGRYAVKHFVLRRGAPGELEIPASQVTIVDQPILWPAAAGARPPPIGEPARHVESSRPTEPGSAIAEQRARDNQFFQELLPSLRPYQSKTTGGVYWRGTLGLVDDTAAEVIVAELDGDDAGRYGVAVKGVPATLETAGERLSQRRFRSATEAVLTLERELNREIYRAGLAERSGRVPKRGR
jgi:integrative and conjugative element protein (TIGR02256 family)